MAMQKADGGKQPAMAIHRYAFRAPLPSPTPFLGHSPVGLGLAGALAYGDTLKAPPPHSSIHAAADPNSRARTPSVPRCIKNRNHKSAYPTPLGRRPASAVSPPPELTPAKVLEVSEECARVVPRVAGARKPDILGGHIAGNPSHDPSNPGGFLSSCHACNKALGNVDIFMYRGEKAFCSNECRYQEMSFEDGIEDW